MEMQLAKIKFLQDEPKEGSGREQKRAIIN